LHRTGPTLAAAAICLGLTLVPGQAQQTEPQQTEPQQTEPQPTEPTPEARPVQRTSRLQGRAYVDRRRNVVGATVLVRPMDDATRLHLTSTDGKGVFRIEGLADGLYRVRVERPGIQTVTKDEVSVRFPFRAVVELAMQPVEQNATRPAGGGGGGPETAGGPVTVFGIVRGDDRAPLNEARLRFVDADGSTDPRTLQTGPDGTFELEQLQAGEWQLIVSGVGMLPIRTRFDLLQATRIEVALVRQPPGYEPSPLELMPPEEPVPPPAFAAGLDQPRPVRTAK